MPHSTGSKALRNKLSSGLAPPRWRRPSALALAFLLALPSGAPPLYAQAAPDTRNALPSLGDSASEDFSVASERRLGERIMRDIRRDPDYLDDPVLLEYLQQLWGGLIAAARARGDIPAELDERFAWELFMVRDRTVNAFALPGGFVGVHLGLVAMTTAPDELASVLAHELSHVTQRHIARSVGAGKTSSLVGLAGLILGVLAASRSPEAAQALITGGQAVAVQGQLNYTRDFEREADRVGFGILTGAGHAPSGMAAMFERLQVASRLNDNQNFPYLRSHPLTSERIGEARSRLGVSGAAAPTAGRPLRYAMVRARARVLMDPREGSLQRVQDFEPAPALPALQASAAAADVATSADKLAVLYASALASLLRRDFARAEASVAAARPLVAAEPAAATMLDQLALQVLLTRGDAARAGVLLQALLAAPGGSTSRPLLLAQAQHALLAGAPADAVRRSRERLQTWVANRPADALAWGSLAQLWVRSGQRLQSVRAEAEARSASGDVTGAIERLRAVQRLAATATGADVIEASVVEARLRELEALRRQIVAEERSDS